MISLPFSTKSMSLKASKSTAAVLFFLVFSLLALNLPSYPGAVSWAPFLSVPIELPLIVLILALIPARFAWAPALLLSLGVACLFLLKLADLAAFSALQRPFNPYLDLTLFSNGWIFISGTFGPLLAGLAILLVCLVLALLFWLYFRSLRVLGEALKQFRYGLLVTSAGTLAVAGLIWALQPALGGQEIFHLRASQYLSDRLVKISRSIADLRKFEKTLDTKDELAGLANNPERMFQALGKRDVILLFVESYGRSAIEGPVYGQLIKPRLQHSQAILDKAGFGTRSTWLRSPTVGGISWLAHGTFLSGLWIDNQARYDLLMRSKRASLNRLFGNAGWETSAIMPAITMAWPEAGYFGYNRIFAAKDLDYQGKPFNWVTMPDQYTFAAFERLVRRPAHANGKPVMAEIALISSHAPWTPIPELIDWQDVGDGSIFNDQATKGDPPAVVWADTDRVRVQYIKAIDYSLETLTDYIARFGESAVFLVLGDHQPAPLITGQGASRAVPFHIITRDKSLLRRLDDAKFSSGLRPRSDLPVQDMNTMRDLLLTTFSQ